MRNRSACFIGPWSLSLALILLGPVAPAVLAQDEVLEEIVVTATRRAETDVQSTPVAVSTVSAAEFAKLFAQDIGEIASFVPNFSAATVTGFNAASFAMRGAAETDIIVYFDPKVGVIVDDFVIPHVQTQLLEPFDIEAIEVLRGPQGTLFGKNTTAGAVVVRTKRPDLEAGAFEASAQYGRFNDVKVRAALNAPLSETLAFRFAGLIQNSDGYYKNGKVDNPVDVFGAGLGDAGNADGSPVAGDGGSVGGKDIFSGRAKLLFEPNEQLSVLTQVELIRDRSDPVPVVNETEAAAGQLATLFGFPGVTDGNPSSRPASTKAAWSAWTTARWSMCSAPMSTWNTPLRTTPFMAWSAIGSRSPACPANTSVPPMRASSPPPGTMTGRPFSWRRGWPRTWTGR